jgi:glyoxylase-like metal-dependent hydrolase (beta-lactamase superfamily II)
MLPVSARGDGVGGHRGRREVLIGRRTLLADLGRVTLAAVVLGPAAAGCADPDGRPEPLDDAPGQSERTSGGVGSLVWERVSLGFVSAYVLVREGEALLFDTGTGADVVGPARDALADAGVGWGDVAHVVVSHRHGDHVGGVPSVAGVAPEATFHAAVPDLEAVRAQVAGAQEVRDGDRVLGVRIVATPGHTPGHVCAHDEEAGLLLAGDAIVNGVSIGGTTGEGIEPSPPEFTADTDLALESVGVLADLRPATILFGHGDPVTAGAAAALDELAAAVS